MQRLKKVVKWMLAVVAMIVIVVPLLLYVPPIQDFARRVALEEVRKSTGMDIGVDYLRLKFPLRVELNGVSVAEASGDTMVRVGSAGIDVKILPLLKGNIEVDGVEAKGLFYRLGTPDSLMYLTANVNCFEASGADLKMRDGRISIGRASVDGGEVYLSMKDTVVQEVADTAAMATPWKVDAGYIDIKNLAFRMTMLPTVDSLGTVVERAQLIGGVVDMAQHTVHARELRVDSVAATYLTPSEEYLLTYKTASETADASVDAISEPWVVTADRLRLTGREVTYAMRGVKPARGMDVGYLQVRNVGIDVDSFYNRGMEISVPVKRIEGTERCGLKLAGSGLFEMDSTVMRVRNFTMKAGESELRCDADLGTGDVIKDPTVPLGLNASAYVNVEDIVTAFPTLETMLRGLPRKDIELTADVDGTSGEIDVKELQMKWPSYIDVRASGSVKNPTDMAKMEGRVDIEGSLRNVNVLMPSLLGAALSKEYHVPASTIEGRVLYRPNSVDGEVAVTTSEGAVALDAHWNGRAEGYEAALEVADFPVRSFVPGLGVGNVTAEMTVNGRGYNPLSAGTEMTVDLDLHSLEYQDKLYSNILLDATVSNGHADGRFESLNPGANMEADFQAYLSPEVVEWHFAGTVRELDLYTMKLSETPLSGRLSIESTGKYMPESGAIDATASLNDVDWQIGADIFSAKRIDATFGAVDSLTTVTVKSGDFAADAAAYVGMAELSEKLSGLMPFVQTQIDAKSVDIHELQRHLPPFDIHANVGASNPFTAFMGNYKMGLRRATMTAHNDSLFHVNVALDDFHVGKTMLNQVSLDANQHGKFLVLNAKMDNKPGTFDDFAHVVVSGYVADDKAALMLKQSNIEDRQGYYLGFAAAFTDSLVKLRMVPYKPVIGYKQWTVNADNHITYNFVDRRLNANLALENAHSKLKLYTESRVEVDSAEVSQQDDVVVHLSNIKIADWMSISPFAPPMSGDLGADMRLSWDDRTVTGSGYVELNDFYYNRERVGSFLFDVDVTTDNKGVMNADVAMKVDDVKVITATGVLNDSTKMSPFLLDFSMIHFPLNVVNPFLPKDVAQMSGMLNGTMNISGTPAKPRFDGYIAFDSAAVNVGLTGASYKFSDERIPVDSSVVRFNDYSIAGLNGNDIHVNGMVDAADMANLGVNLAFNARNMQVVNSQRPRGASLYGKAFVDLDATAKGNMNFLDVRASLNVLPETNVTYVMTTAESAIQSQSVENMVQFVQFNDTLSIAADSIMTNAMAMNLEAILKVSEGSTINVDMSSDSKNRVSVKGEGTLNYTLNPMDDGRLTGRFTLNSGFARYTPPFMSEKYFTLKEGSYVAFNGDMLNPTLNIMAVDEMKSNVSTEGQNSRSVNFIVSLSVTQTLQNMNVAFDLSTNDDITIQNELASMSQDQRANQAMNLLLYNVYTGPGSKGSNKLSGNLLFTFLESQVNTWAANNIRFVDVSFGIDQNDQTSEGTSSTSYSYRVSKTLFNDRFKIVVGGNYSTDADADENFSQNLINDISFEYMLNRSGSKYLRLFRHVGYESILEGEITQTGVGFVYRHKLKAMRDLFKWLRPRKRRTPATTATMAEPVKQQENESKQK